MKIILTIVLLVPLVCLLIRAFWPSKDALTKIKWFFAGSFDSFRWCFGYDRDRRVKSEYFRTYLSGGVLGTVVFMTLVIGGIGGAIYLWSW